MGACVVAPSVRSRMPVVEMAVSKVMAERVQTNGHQPVGEYQAKWRPYKPSLKSGRTIQSDFQENQNEAIEINVAVLLFPPL